MANTYTAAVKLAMPSTGDTGWATPVNSNAAALDALAPVGGLCVTTHEQPSSTLAVDVAAGKYVKRDWSVGAYAGISGQPIASGSTKVLYLDGTSAYALAVAAAYPATQHVRLATVVTGASTIVSISDDRLGPIVVGT